MGQRSKKSGKPARHGGGGLLKMRSGFRSALSGKKRGPKSKLAMAFDVVFWIAVVAVLFFLYYRRGRG